MQQCTMEPSDSPSPPSQELQVPCRREELQALLHEDHFKPTQKFIIKYFEASFWGKFVLITYGEVCCTISCFSAFNMTITSD